MLQLFTRGNSPPISQCHMLFFRVFSLTRSCWYSKMQFRFQLKQKKKILIYPICLFLFVVFIGLYTESSSINDESTYSVKRWVELQCLLYILIIYFFSPAYLRVCSVCCLLQTSAPITDLFRGCEGSVRIPRVPMTKALVNQSFYKANFYLTIQRNPAFASAVI